jgi:DNA-binding PadR family transcriptional regulator
MMVLGLVVRQPDTVAGIGRRLHDQFRAAGFARSTAYSSLPSLAADGYALLARPGPPKEPTLDFYEATPAGREHFLQWMRCTDVPVLVRDIFQCKLELAEPEDVPAILEFVRALEDSFLDMSDAARLRLRREQRSRSSHPDQASEWRRRMRSLQIRDEAVLWALMAQRLERLVEELEQMHAGAAPKETS